MIFRILFHCLLLLYTLQTEAKDEIPVVAVAANFSPVLEEIVNQFTISSGHKVRISTGASGNLFRQIEQGAPFELFLSANETYIEQLHENGLSPDAGRLYATGKLVLFIPYTSRLDKMQNVQDILRKLISDKSYRIAIANPELAPYGLAAKQVLSRFATYHMLSDHIILGENVGQTAQFALTGSVDAAFLPYSLAISKHIQSAGYFEHLPTDWYRPINQRMVLLNNAGESVRQLYDYLVSNNAQQIILKYGFALPED